MAAANIEELYANQLRLLSTADRWRLIALLAQDLVQPVAEREEGKLTITERLARANYQGGSSFRTAEEVDAYIRAERDSWER